jgi:thiamine-phosphate pyrophosphorylase
MAADAPAQLTRIRRAALLHGIYVVLNDEPRLLALARAVLDAGVCVVQYRAKNGLDAARLRALREITRERGALLVVNDDWRAAAAFECDGVHLGPGDDGFADVAPVRTGLPECIIGLSCGTVDETRDAGGQDVDYLGVGAVYATASKADAGTPIGIAGLREIARQTALPVAAIGGITAQRVAEVRRSGVAMAAVLSAVADAPEPRRAACELVAQWNAT